MNYRFVKSIISLTCPQCRKEKLFVKKGLFVYSKMLSMPENCSNCGQKFEIEPGFWYGALWTSYPLVVMVELPFLLTAYYSTFGNPWIAFLMMLGAFFLCWPFFLRLGRSIWIHIWVKYQPN